MSGRVSKSAALAVAHKHGDDIDGFGDQRARHGDHAFLDKLFEPPQRAKRRTSVKRADPAWMTGAPRFQQIKCFCTAHLANGNAVGPQTQRRSDKIGQGRNAVLGPQRHQIGRCALQLQRILDQDDTVGRGCDLGEQRIGERRLACRGAADDQNVLSRSDRSGKRFGLPFAHDPGRHVIGQREHRDSWFADGEARGGNHRGQQAFEALAAFRQFGGHTRYACMNLGADMMGNQPDDALTIGCTHQTFGRRETLAQSVDPETPIGVEHDFDDIGLVEPASDVAAKRSAQHARTAR